MSQHVPVPESATITDGSKVFDLDVKALYYGRFKAVRDVMMGIEKRERAAGDFVDLIVIELHLLTQERLSSIGKRRRPLLGIARQLRVVLLERASIGCQVASLGQRPENRIETYLAGSAWRWRGRVGRRQRRADLQHTNGNEQDSGGAGGQQFHRPATIRPHALRGSGCFASLLSCLRGDRRVGSLRFAHGGHSLGV